MWDSLISLVIEMAFKDHQWTFINCCATIIIIVIVIFDSFIIHIIDAFNRNDSWIQKSRSILTNFITTTATAGEYHC